MPIRPLLHALLRGSLAQVIGDYVVMLVHTPLHLRLLATRGQRHGRSGEKGSDNL